MIQDKSFYNEETERKVLGAIVVDSKCLFDIGELFTPQIFHTLKHKEIAQVIFEMSNKNIPIDSLTLFQNLRKSSVSGEVIMYANTELTTGIIISSNAGSWIQELVELFIKRKLHEENQRIDFMLTEKADAFDLINEAETKIAEILPSIIPAKGKTVKQVFDNTLEQIELMQTRPGGLVGIDTGFQKLNEITSGWQKQQLIIIAARPAMGKTALMLRFIKQAAIFRKIPVGIFSIEMSSEMLMNRMISIESGVEQEKILRGEMNAVELSSVRGVSYIRESKIYFDESNVTLNHLRNKARVWKMKFGVQAIFVDYLQIVNNRGSKANREQQVSEISGTLKAIAKELDIPIIALAQLSRDASGSRPQLANLRESGSIEQDADMVMFIHRPNYYSMNITGIEEDVEFIIAKHRNGATGLFNVNFNPALTKFYDNFDSGYSSGFNHKGTDF